MPAPTNQLFTLILTQCAAAAPQPWYPSSYSGAGTSREELDAALDQLRLANLVRLTDWVQGRGQGYALTAAGEDVLGDPRTLQRVSQGSYVAAPAEDFEPAAQQGRISPWERGELVRSVLLDPPKPVVMMAILFLNLAMFGYGVFRTTQAKLPANAYLSGNDPRVAVINHELGALNAADVVARRQWWRLGANMFVHWGAIHLIMNMFALYSLGGLVEAMLGRWRFLFAYLTAGLGGGCAVVLQDAQGLTAGASGAICGLLGSMLAWVVLNRAYLPPGVFGAWMRNIIMNVFLIAIISSLPGVSWTGHLGGGIAGAVVTVPLVWNRFGSGAMRLVGFIVAILVPVACVALIVRQFPEALGALPENAKLASKADELFDQTYQHTVGPFLARTKVPQDEEGWKQIRAKVRDTQDELAKTWTQMAAGAAKDYVGAAASFMETVHNVLTHQRPPTAQETQGLEAIYAEVEKLHARWRLHRP